MDPCTVAFNRCDSLRWPMNETTGGKSLGYWKAGGASSA